MHFYRLLLYAIRFILFYSLILICLCVAPQLERPLKGSNVVPEFDLLTVDTNSKHILRLPQDCYMNSLRLLCTFCFDDNHIKMSICPRHRDAFGIRWRSGKRTCSAPKDWAAHKSKQVKGDRGITLPQCKRIFTLTSVLVPVASRK